jgi:hypothetical protein
VNVTCTDVDDAEPIEPERASDCDRNAFDATLAVGSGSVGCTR